MANLVWRSFIAMFGLFAMAWAGHAVLIYRTDAGLKEAQQRILSGDRFNRGQLNSMKGQLEVASDRPHQASSLSGVALIRLLLLEDDMSAGNRQAIGSNLDDVQSGVRAALAQSPTNSFMWLTDFWLKRLRGESAEMDLNVLRMSYRFAPNEAWIAVKRNSLALSVFPSLPDDIAEQALAEFVGLVRSGLYSASANILAGPGWAVREKLLGRLVQVEEIDRRGLAKALELRDLDGLTVPGVDKRLSRPF